MELTCKKITDTDDNTDDKDRHKVMTTLMTRTHSDDNTDDKDRHKVMTTPHMKLCHA